MPTIVSGRVIWIGGTRGGKRAACTQSYRGFNARHTSMSRPIGSEALTELCSTPSRMRSCSGCTPGFCRATRSQLPRKLTAIASQESVAPREVHACPRARQRKSLSVVCVRSRSATLRTRGAQSRSGQGSASGAGREEGGRYAGLEDPQMQATSTL